MDRSTVIRLISESYAKDEYGVSRKTTSGREVFAQVDSVTRNEFFEGGRNGLNPEYEFRLLSEEYEGERVVSYNGKRYAVYRVYEARNDIIELYAEREGGTNA